MNTTVIQNVFMDNDLVADQIKVDKGSIESWWFTAMLWCRKGFGHALLCGVVAEAMIWVWTRIAQCWYIVPALWVVAGLIGWVVVLTAGRDNLKKCPKVVATFVALLSALGVSALLMPVAAAFAAMSVWVHIIVALTVIGWVSTAVTVLIYKVSYPVDGRRLFKAGLRNL